MMPSGVEHLTACLAEARAGDQRAFDRLFEGLSSDRCLLSIVSSIPPRLRAKIDAEDILQRVRLCVWRDIGQLRDVNTAGFHRWACGIGRNLVVDEVRRSRAKRRDIGREEGFGRSAASAILADEHTPSKSVARHERVAQLAELLDELKDSYRAVIVSRILDGCSTEETARALSMSPENVSVTLHRALAKFRELLKEHGIDSMVFRLW